MFVLYSAHKNVYQMMIWVRFLLFFFHGKFESLTSLWLLQRNMMRSFIQRTVLLAVVAVTTCAGTGERRPAAANKRQAPTEGDYADRSSDGSYAFRYADRNQFHTAVANKDNVVSGRYSVCYITHLYVCTVIILLLPLLTLCDKYGQRRSGRYAPP